MNQSNYHNEQVLLTNSTKFNKKIDDNASIQSWDQNSQENYEIMPRQNQFYSPRKDKQIEYNSKPFVSSHQLGLENRLPSAGSSHITNKTLQELNLKQAQSQHESSIDKHLKQLNTSFVSNSSENKEENSKQIKIINDQMQENQSHSHQILFDLRQISHNENKYHFKTDYDLNVIPEISQNSYLTGRKVVSIQESQQYKQSQEISNQYEEVLYKYHFQTQKQCVKIQTKNERNNQKRQVTSIKSINQSISSQSNDIFVSPLNRQEVKGQQNMFSIRNEDYNGSVKNVLNKQLIKQQSRQSDRYIWYKKSAQSSPLISSIQVSSTLINKQSSPMAINKQSYVSIQKHSSIQTSPSPTIFNSYKPSNNNNFQSYQKDRYISNNQKQKSQQKQILQKQLQKSMKEIDNLKKQLVKSTQNNINAIFNTNLTQQCCISQTIKGIKGKVNQLCNKIQTMEDKRIQNIQKYIYSQKIRHQEIRHQEEERSSGNRHHSNVVRNQNMIIDLGKPIPNQGKIIAIYPQNQMVSIKDLMFGNPLNQSHNQLNQQRQRQRQRQRQTSLKMMIQMQQTFLKTLKMFQQQVNINIDKKLQQYRLLSQQNRKKSKSYYSFSDQRIQKLSQQTTDRDEDIDDSRGSINVLYIRKLRQFQQQIKQKGWKIQRLEKQKYYLEKQLQKIQVINNYQQINLRGNNIKSPKNHNEINYMVVGHNNRGKVRQQINNMNSYNTNNEFGQRYKYQINPLTQHVSYQTMNLNFNKSKNIQGKSVASSSQRSQQRIKQITCMTNEQINHVNTLTYNNNNNNNLSLINNNKKKNTHSFHHQSKNVHDIQINQLKDKINQYQLALKQKDIRIGQLQNIIMDHLESSRKWKHSSQHHNSNSSTSSITGYSSVNSQQNNSQLLHMKINNLKTLLKQSKKQVQHFKKLYQNQKQLINHQSISQQTLNQNVKLGQEQIRSNTSKSMCVSQKTTVRNQKNVGIRNDRNVTSNNDLTNYISQKSPFAQIQVVKDVNNEYHNLSQKLKSQQIIINKSVQSIVNFILMSWSLKQIISKLCNKQVNLQKINRNASNFIKQIKDVDFYIWKRIYKQIQVSQFSVNIISIWF